MNKIFFLFLNVFIMQSLITTAQTDWVWQNPLPQGNDLKSVYFVNANTGYAVGNGSVILKTTDGGTNWSVNYDVNTSKVTFIYGLYAVYFTDANTGYVVGDCGAIFKTTDGGISWSQQPKVTTGCTSLLSVFFTGADTGYAVGEGGSIIKTTNGGTNWIAQASGNSGNKTLNSVFFIDADTGYAVGNVGNILKTTDGGTNWIAQASGTKQYCSVFFTDADTGYTVGGGGTILKTTNGGSNWIAQSSGITKYLYSVFFTDANTGYAVGESGAIIKTTDGGSNWITQSSSTASKTLKSVFFADADTGYALGIGGTILKTTDGGTNWIAQLSSTASKTLLSVFFADADTGYTVGYGGTILKTSDGGTNWVAQASGTTQYLNSVFFAGADTGYTVGSVGTILKTTDGGSNWIAQSSDTTTDLNSVFFTDANTGYVVGYGGTILKTTDGGSNWIAQSSGTTDDLNSVFFTNADTGYALGWWLLLKTTNGGNTWWNTGGGYGDKMYFTDADTGYVVSESGIFKTTDGGSNWTSYSISNMTLGYLFSIYFADANNGYAVGDLGTIVNTVDAGTTWNIQPVSTNLFLNSVFFTDANTGYVVGENGIILKLDNGAVIKTKKNVSCNGGNDGIATVYPDGGVAPYSVHWSNGQTDTVITGLVAGNYAATVTDNTGYIDIASVTISEPLPFTIEFVTKEQCSGKVDGSITTTVSGATSPYTYAWSNGVTTQDLTGISANIYGVTVTDANGCKDTATSVITEPTPFVIQLFTNDASCPSKADGSITTTVSGATSPYTYAWSNGVTTQVLTSISANIYGVTVTDANGCKDTATSVITEPSPFVIQLFTNDASCSSKADGSFTTTVSGATSPYTYTWSNDSILHSVNNSTIQFYNLNAGFYGLTILDANGCDTSLQIIVDALTCDSVWPGDCNMDGIVSWDDLFDIGIYYELTGNSRTDQGIEWRGYEAQNWGGVTTNNSDMKHVDCDGNGTIYDEDSKAVEMNYNLSHSKTVSHQNQMGNPELYFKILSSDIIPGGSVEIAIMLGKDTAVSVYGIGYEISIDRLLLQKQSLQIDFNGKMLTKDTNYIDIVIDGVTSSNSIICAITRTDKSNIVDFGEITRLKFTIDSNATVGSSFKLKIINSGGTLANGNKTYYNHPTGSETDTTITINPIGISNNKLFNSDFSVVPNPFNSITNISYNLNRLSEVNLEVYDLLGKKVATLLSSKHQNAGKHLIKYNSDNFGYPAGVYILKLQINEGSYWKRLVQY